ncbi:MAG: HEAT repeat domain-containing protein [Candidatus Gastranaerophilales bacterium]|nr:HEAT repeat domain-containing protein [Candidatus Gastranaerophilales bacterium]
MLDNTQEKNIIVQTETAYELNLAENNYEKLLDFLRSDSLDLTYFALLKIEKLKTKEDSLFLLNLLKPHQDSRIREQASNLIKDHCHYFDNEDSIRFLTEAIRDKNPKVCRNITYTLQKINNRFMIIEKLVNIIQEEIENSDKEQIKNRAVFTIYWSLFAIENLLNPESLTINTIENLIETVQKTSGFKEYQIRERSAVIVKLLTKINNHEKLVQLKELFLNDENFYVRVAIS